MPVSGLHLDAGDEGDDPAAPLGLAVSPLSEDRGGMVAVRVPLDDRGGSPFCIFGTPDQLFRLAAELVDVVDRHLRALDDEAEAEPVTVDEVAQALTDVSGRPWAVATDEADG